MIEHRPSVDDTPEHEVGSRFLMRCGRFAVVTPPAMNTPLAVSSIPREAHASTIGRPTETKRRMARIGCRALRSTRRASGHSTCADYSRQTMLPSCPLLRRCSSTRGIILPGKLSLISPIGADGAAA